MQIKRIIKIRLGTSVVQPLWVRSLGNSSDDSGSSSSGDLKPHDDKRRCVSLTARERNLSFSPSVTTPRVDCDDQKGRIGLACCLLTPVSVRRIEAAKEKETGSKDPKATQSTSWYGFRMG